MGRHLIALALLLLINGQRTSSFSLDFGDIREILQLGREIGINALESAEWIRKGSQNDSELNFPFIKKMERKLMEQMFIVNRRLDTMEMRIDQRAGEIVDILLRELPSRLQLDRNLHELNKHLGRIDAFYRKFDDYASHRDKYEVFTMKDFAKSCVSIASGDLPDLIESIHRLLVPRGSGNFERSVLVQLAQISQEASAQICNEQQSPQQLLYNLYNTIALAEIKGYTMMQFSYTILRLYKNGTFDEERSNSARDYATRTAETLKAVKTAMAFAPRDLWRCDPSVHEEGTTYAEMKQVFQGYIVNEVDLNPSSTCRENCGYYSYTKVHGCYDNLYCSQQRKCNGKVLHCQYIDSDMWICPAPKDSSRRYEYIQYENGNVYGNNKGSCRRPTTKVDSWWRWLFWHCSYCMCYCDDHTASSERYFNLREITSDIINNKVVTGMKMVKANGIIHPQIQQGVLGERGDISKTTVDWKPVDNFTILDNGVINSKDFHALSWEKRAMDLDDLEAPDGHVLTGVRWRMVGAHLNFEIRVTPFNFTTGKLYSEKNLWMSNDNTDVGDHAGNDRRTELKFNKPDIPSRSKAPNLPDSRTNQFLNFGPTDLGADAGQTTVPFLDMQPVVTDPPFPLAGAGVYHKGREGYGGYVGFKVFTYDFKNHLRAEVPEPPPVVGLNDIPVN